MIVAISRPVRMEVGDPSFEQGRDGGKGSPGLLI